MKIPVEPLARLEAERHKETCEAEMTHKLVASRDMLYLGPLDEIDVNDNGETAIWVENGKVYHTIRCPPNVPYQSLLSTMIWLSLVGNCWENSDKAFPIQNGDTKFWRKPTTSFSLRQSINRNQRYPVVVMEMAGNHESLHRLLCKASVWLNEHTDVAYCFVVKMDVKNPQDVTIYILERTEPAATSLVKMEPKTVINKPIYITEELVDRLRRTKPNTIPEIPFDKEAIQTDEGIERKYKVRVMYKDVISEATRKGETRFKLNARKVYAKSIYADDFDKMGL